LLARIQNEQAAQYFERSAYFLQQQKPVRVQNIGLLWPKARSNRLSHLRTNRLIGTPAGSLGERKAAGAYCRQAKKN